MQFIRYIEHLSAELGDHQLPLNDHWLKASGIVRADAVHYDLMKELVARIYRQNKCSNPGHPVELETILDCLGQLHHEMSESESPDFEAMELLQWVGEISVVLFGDLMNSEDSDFGDEVVAS